jgi:hypothetical protein
MPLAILFILFTTFDFDSFIKDYKEAQTRKESGSKAVFNRLKIYFKAMGKALLTYYSWFIYYSILVALAYLYLGLDAAIIYGMVMLLSRNRVLSSQTSKGLSMTYSIYKKSSD